MSNAYKCFRCGELNEGNPEMLFKFPNPFDQGLVGDDTRNIRLCADCQESLTEFLDGAPTAREVDRRAERLSEPAGYPMIDFELSREVEEHGNTRKIELGDRVHSFSFTIGQEEDTETVLKEQVELGARNY